MVKNHAFSKQRIMKNDYNIVIWGGGQIWRKSPPRGKAINPTYRFDNQTLFVPNLSFIHYFRYKTWNEVSRVESIHMIYGVFIVLVYFYIFSFYSFLREILGHRSLYSSFFAGIFFTWSGCSTRRWLFSKIELFHNESPAVSSAKFSASANSAKQPCTMLWYDLVCRYTHKTSRKPFISLRGATFWSPFPPPFYGVYSTTAVVENQVRFNFWPMKTGNFLRDCCLQWVSPWVMPHTLFLSTAPSTSLDGAVVVSHVPPVLDHGNDKWSRQEDSEDGDVFIATFFGVFFFLERADSEVRLRTPHETSVCDAYTYKDTSCIDSYIFHYKVLLTQLNETFRTPKALFYVIQ